MNTLCDKFSRASTGDTHCAASPPSPSLPSGRRVLVTVKRAQAHECWVGRLAPRPRIHAQTCASSRCTMGRDQGGGKTTCDPCACNMAVAGHSNLETWPRDGTQKPPTAKAYHAGPCSIMVPTPGIPLPTKAHERYPCVQACKVQPERTRGGV